MKATQILKLSASDLEQNRLKELIFTRFQRISSVAVSYINNPPLQ
jgi:hypothetical protein